MGLVQTHSNAKWSSTWRIWLDAVRVPVLKPGIIRFSAVSKLDGSLWWCVLVTWSCLDCQHVWCPRDLTS